MRGLCRHGLPAGLCLTECSPLGLGGGCHSPCVWSQLTGQQPQATPQLASGSSFLSCGVADWILGYQPDVPQTRFTAAWLFRSLEPMGSHSHLVQDHQVTLRETGSTEVMSLCLWMDLHEPGVSIRVYKDVKTRCGDVGICHELCGLGVTMWGC